MTKDKSLAVLMRSLANHGRDGIYISIDDDNELTKSQLSMVMNKRFEFEDVGYSYRATEMEAALGLAQLKGWKKMIAKRQSNAKYLTEKLSPLSHQLSLPKIRPETDHVFMVYPIVITDKNFARDDVILTLEKNGIETRKLLPTLSQPVYKRLFGTIESSYPVAKRVSDNGFYVGCHQDLSHKDLDWLVTVLTKALKSS
jgi:CDP-6-deoxy-D-xylo-4-hexulose-3-dehydrase